MKDPEDLSRPGQNVKLNIGIQMSRCCPKDATFEEPNTAHIRKGGGPRGCSPTLNQRLLLRFLQPRCARVSDVISQQFLPLFFSKPR